MPTESVNPNAALIMKKIIRPVQRSRALFGAIAVTFTLIGTIVAGLTLTSPTTTPQPASNSVKDNTSPATHEDVSSPSPTAVSSDDAKDGKGKNQEPNCSKENFLEWTKRYEPVINGFSAITMAIFTVILTIFTVKLWQSGEKHSERELRAYISYPSVEIRNFGDNHVPIEAVLNVKNCGQTPAYDVRDSIAIAVAKFPCLEFPEPELKPSNASIGPGDGGITSLKMDTVLFHGYLTAILKGEMVIYVSAEIRYWDAFRKKERFTRYRGFYRGTGSQTFYPNKVLELKHTEDGNDSS